MVETSRVARWRQRLRDEGKEALTIWLTTYAKRKLEDLAYTYRTSPSALVQQALDQFQPAQPSGVSTNADTTQLRLLIRDVLREELPDMIRELVDVTDTRTETVAATPSMESVADAVTEIVAATLARDLPALVRQIIEAMALEAMGLPVTATSGDVADTESHGEMPATEASAEDLAVSPPGQTPAYDADRYYLGKLCPRSHDWHGTGHSLRYTHNRVCPECDREKTTERRQALRSAKA
jgi:hypothetical protein